MSYTPNQQAEKVGFLTTTPLSASGVYTSSLIDANGWSQVQTEVNSDQDGTMLFEFCSDAAGTDVVRSLTVPFVAANGYQLFGAPAFTNYIKYTFTNNSGSSQTDFYFTTKLLSTALSPQTLRADGFISSAMMTNLNRSIIVGTDVAGNYRNVGTDAEGHLKVHVDEPLTAFGELRTAEMTPILQITHPYELNLDLMATGNTTASGSVVHNTGTTMIEVNSGAATSSAGIANTRKLVKYRNGQGLLVRYTALFDTAVSGNNQLVGWGDSEDGFFFGYSGTTFGIIRKNIGSGDEFIAQSNWNIDTMDGSSNSSNPSSQNLDPTNGNVYQIQVQWLGFGAINFFVEASETGQFEPVHQIKYANSNTNVSVVNPTYSLRIESTNTTNSTNVTIQNASLAAFNEGEVRYTGPTKSFGNGKTSTTNTVQFSLQNPSTYKGRTNRSRIKLQSLNVYADQSNADPVQFRLVLDATLASTSFASFGNYTAIETDLAGTYSSGGDDIFQAGTSEVDSKVIDLTPYDIFVNPGETISVLSDGSNTGAGAALTWVEDI
jgi:hypothetical protein